MNTQAWTIPVRAVLALMWITHSLEKFGVQWPPPIAGGTNSVAGMLGFMADETPLPFLRRAIEGFLLPNARLLQVPVGAIELALGLAIGLAVANGRFLPWAPLAGAALQSFIWLGFVAVAWPLQYPLVIALHLALLAPLARRPAGPGLQRFARTALYAAPVVVGLLIVAYRADWFGSWPWTYYLLAAGCTAFLLLGRDGSAQRQQTRQA